MGAYDEHGNRYPAMESPDAGCCHLGCGDNGIDCPCCSAGWCVSGTDGIPEDAEDRAVWLDVAARHNPIAAALLAAEQDAADVRRAVAAEIAARLGTAPLGTSPRQFARIAREAGERG